MNVAFLKYLTNKDLKIPVKIAKKMKTTSCAGSPYINMRQYKYSSLSYCGILCIRHGDDLIAVNCCRLQSIAEVSERFSYFMFGVCVYLNLTRLVTKQS